MKKLLIVFFCFLSFQVFAEELTSFMGIKFGSSVEEAEKILAENEWREVSDFDDHIIDAYRKIFLEKEYAGGSYAGVRDFKLVLSFLKDDDKTKLFRVNLNVKKSDDIVGEMSVVTSRIDKFRENIKFADIFEALSRKYDWSKREGNENIRRYNPNGEIRVRLCDKNNSNVTFVRYDKTDLSYYGDTWIYEGLHEENLWFEYEPICSIQRKKIEMEKQRMQELEEQNRLKQIDALKDSL